MHLFHHFHPLQAHTNTKIKQLKNVNTFILWLCCCTSSEWNTVVFRINRFHFEAFDLFLLFGVEFCWSNVVFWKYESYIISYNLYDSKLTAKFQPFRRITYFYSILSAGKSHISTKFHIFFANFSTFFRKIAYNFMQI